MITNSNINLLKTYFLLYLHTMCKDPLSWLKFIMYTCLYYLFSLALFKVGGIYGVGFGVTISIVIYTINGYSFAKNIVESGEAITDISVHAKSVILNHISGKTTTIANKDLRTVYTKKLGNRYVAVLNKTEVVTLANSKQSESKIHQLKNLVQNR